MTAHFINVGQAESFLLEFKTAAILIDAGGEVQGMTAIGIAYSPTLTGFSQEGPISGINALPIRNRDFKGSCFEMGWFSMVKVIEPRHLLSFQLLRGISEGNSSLASQSIPSWNQIIVWLREMETLRKQPLNLTC